MQTKLQWYVLRSKPNKEMVLWRELSARGFECFYPCLRLKPVNPRSRKIRPYFPGYLFVYADIEQVGASTFQWMPFSGGFVSFDEVLATVPDNLIQAIRRHVEQINAAGGEQMAGLKQGDAVRIQGGPFDGYEGIFDARLPGRERVRVLLKLLQIRQVGIELPTAQIQRLRQKGR
jgi:transcriptional antiterminator RfaH